MCGHKCAKRKLNAQGIVIGLGKLIFANAQIRYKKRSYNTWRLFGAQQEDLFR
jgi:hypothetical protein